MSRRRQLPDDPSGEGRALAIGLALAGLVLVLYGRAAGHAFIDLDDNRYVVDNSIVRQGLTPEGLRWALTTFHLGNWHPLTWLSHMLDCELFGLAAGGHHLVNVLLHALNSLLLLAALRALTGALWPSTLAAALFALHPLRVESVAWIAERKDLLAGLFWMLGLLAYGWYVRRPRPARYALVFAAMALGLLAKPMLVTLPCVLLLLDLWPLARLRSTGLGRLLVEKLPLVALSAASSAVSVLAQREGGAVSTLVALPLGSRVANALISYVVYLGQAAWPARLAVYYPHPAVIASEGPSSMVPAAAGAGLLLAAATALAVRQWRRRPYLAVGWFWYLGTLVPVIGLFQVGSQARADRYTYLPLIGIGLLCAWGLRDLVERWPQARFVVAAVAAALLAVYSTATWFQLGHWRTSGTLFEHALHVTEGNALIHNNLGAVLAREGNVEGARHHFELALRIRPAYAEAHYNLGLALERQGVPAGAAAEYQLALALEPGYADAHINLGVVRARTGDLDDARRHFETALRIRPDSAEAHNDLGGVLQAQGDLDGARHHFERAIQIRPAYSEAHRNLGLVLQSSGRLDEAIARYHRALELAGADAGLRRRILDDLAAAYAASGDPEQAARWRTAARESPPGPD